MAKRITARVQITVEIDLVLENWNDNSTIDQVHREGAEAGLAKINKLCERYVRIVGKPKVEAIITERDSRG